MKALVIEKQREIGLQPARVANRREGGFTLIEIMIVVVILGIVAAFAYPSFQDSARKARRADAKTALHDLAARQESFFANNKRYAASPADLGGSATSEQGYYDLQITDLDGFALDWVSGYILDATAPGTSPQIDDTGCTTMTLSSTGTRTPPACW